VIAVALRLRPGASFYEATRLANYAGGLVVMKRGTATVSQGDFPRGPRAITMQLLRAGR